MYPVTNAVKALYAAEQRQFLRITGTDKNGVAINITDANVVLGSFNIDRYSCNGNRLEVGTAIAAEMTVKLDNHAGTYNGVVFEGTELFVEIGIGDPVQWMPCGYFTPDEQPRTANQITIHALDRMVKFDNSVPGLLPWTTETGEIVTNEADQPIYFMTDLAYPATIQSIIQTVCGYYYIPFTQDISSFPNYNLTISEAPNLQQTITFRNIIQWCAGIMGTCAWIDWTGSLRFSWYGATTGYVSTPANRFSSDLHEDDVEITGVQYTNLQNYTVLAGRPEYTIDMTGNYLMAGNVTQILTTVNNSLNGYTYRPFNATIINAPYLWPMDEITFTDKDGNDHTCILTNVNFGINGAMSIEGKGESMQAASRDALSGMTKEQGVLVEQAREATQQLNVSLTQEEIFNRLTDNGEEQGLILYNGKLYLNASYIRAGTVSADILKGGVLKLGGENNVNGVMQVLDASGDIIMQADETGLSVYKGEISGPSITLGGANNEDGTLRVNDESANVAAEITNDGIYSYTSDGKVRSVQNTGGFSIQAYYEFPPIGWNDILNLAINSSRATIDSDARSLYVHGQKSIEFSNRESGGIPDVVYTTASMEDDAITITLFNVDSGTVSIQVNNNNGLVVSRRTNEFIPGVPNPSELTFDSKLTLNVPIYAPSVYPTNGASGSFTTADGKTVTVTNGIITNIA